MTKEELEKGNERLTDELKTLRESIKDYGAGCYENGLRNGKRKLEEQLTKAKDHIKKLLDCLKQDTNDPQTNYYVCQYMDKAEQFLSEVKK